MRVVLLAALLCGSFISSASAETLPWLNKATTTQKAATQNSGNTLPWQNTGPSAPAPVNTMPPAMMEQPVMEDPQTRQLDDRKLNSLATDYYAISTKSPTAERRLGTLQKQVTAFRKVLEGRAYGARDLISDAKKLEGRIAAAKKKAQAENPGIAATAQAKADAVAAKAMETVKKMEKDAAAPKK